MIRLADIATCPIVQGVGRVAKYVHAVLDYRIDSSISLSMLISYTVSCANLVFYVA